MKHRCVACGWEFDGEPGELSTCPVCEKGKIGIYVEGQDALKEEEKAAGYLMHQMLKAWMQRFPRYAVFCITMNPKEKEPNQLLFEVFAIMNGNEPEHSETVDALVSFMNDNRDRF